MVDESSRRWTARALRASATLLLAAAASAAGAAGTEGPAVRGVTDGEVVIGIPAAFSGTSRELGRQMKVGLETAFAAVNDAGGVAGRKLRLVAADHGNDTARAAQAAKELVEAQNVFAFVGPTGSAAVEAYLPWLLDHQVLLFGSLSGASFLRNEPPDKHVFNVRASYSEEAAAAVRYLIEIRRLKPAQIAFFGQDDAYGESGWRGFAQQLRHYHRDPALAVRTMFQRNTVEIEDALRKIKQSGSRTRAVVMFATHRPATKLIEKLHGDGLVFVNASAVEAQELADELVALGPAATRDVLLTQVVPDPTARAGAILRYQELLKKYQSGERPDFISLQGYIAGLVFVEGLKRAGRNLTTDSLVEALEGMHGFDPGLGAPFTFGPSEHQALHKVWGLSLGTDGRWKTIDLE